MVYKIKRLGRGIVNAPAMMERFGKPGTVVPRYAFGPPFSS